MPREPADPELVPQRRRNCAVVICRSREINHRYSWVASYQAFRMRARPCRWSKSEMSTRPSRYLTSTHRPGTVSIDSMVGEGETAGASVEPNTDVDVAAGPCSTPDEHAATKATKAIAATGSRHAEGLAPPSAPPMERSRAPPTTGVSISECYSFAVTAWLNLGTLHRGPVTCGATADCAGPRIDAMQSRRCPSLAKPIGRVARSP